MARLPVRLLIVSYDRVWSWQAEFSHEAGHYVRAPGFLVHGSEPGDNSSGMLHPGEIEIVAHASRGEAWQNTDAERLALAVLHGDREATSTLIRAASDLPHSRPSRPVARKRRRQLPYAKISIEEGAQVTHYLAHEVRIQEQKMLHGSMPVAGVGSFSIAGKCIGPFPVERPDAERLALAVLAGDRQAALLLADSVLMDWSEHGKVL